MATARSIFTSATSTAKSAPTCSLAMATERSCRRGPGCRRASVRDANNTLAESFLACLFVDVDGDGFQDLVLGATNPDASANSVILF